MKIGILTFPKSPSFGAALQMYGLYRALENLGCDVEIINYRNTFMSKKKHITRAKNPLKNMLIDLLDLPVKKKFHNFEEQLSFFPANMICEKDDLTKVAQRYDYLICGSDQVWNPHITGEDLHYFFSFCNDGKKKISYAASFGVNALSDHFSQKIKEQLQQFHHISVREAQGAKIVSKLLGRGCDIVLDPTMLLTRAQWSACEKKINGLPPRYIARFIFNHDPLVEQQIDALQKKTSLPVVTIGGTFVSKLKKGLFTGPIGPEQWLYALHHADYVVTDSFHGAAFSIILQKNLFVSMASSTNSRLQTLLHTFGLDSRVIGEKLDQQAICYEAVQAIMDEKREDSLHFLKKALNIGD